MVVAGSCKRDGGMRAVGQLDETSPPQCRDGVRVRLATFAILTMVAVSCGGTEATAPPTSSATAILPTSTTIAGTFSSPSTVAVVTAPQSSASPRASVSVAPVPTDPPMTQPAVAPAATPPAMPAQGPVTPPAFREGATAYVVPVAEVDRASWGDTHSAYPASDIFVDCGAVIVAPVNGVVIEARRENRYDPAIDNPATRGGRSVTIVGDDGVRYYLAHFESIDAAVEPGARVVAGQPLGLMGQTGRASACHVHFAISPPCPGTEWSVRRGVVWPYPYLDDWRAGGQRSPVDEVRSWLAANPDACAVAMADPHAADA